MAAREIAAMAAGAGAVEIDEVGGKSLEMHAAILPSRGGVTISLRKIAIAMAVSRATSSSFSGWQGVNGEDS